jgi:hypothetical protein
MTIGEILDRAISTYVRRCLPFFVILAITVVPVSLIQLAALPGFTHLSALLAELNRLPPSDLAGRNLVLTQMLGSINFGSLFAVFIAGPLIFFPVSRNAIMTYANATLEGVPVSIAAVYRVSIAKWPAQLVTTLGYFAIGATAGIIISIGFVLVAVLVFLVAGRAAGAFAVLIVLLPFAVAVALAIALLNVAFELASISVALEESNPIRAIGNGWRRTFDRALLRRTIGVALAFLAVELLGSVGLLAVGALLQSLTHSDVVQSVVAAIANILITGVLAVFMVIYSRDVRLRREGSDLLRAANEPSPAP